MLKNHKIFSVLATAVIVLAAFFIWQKIAKSDLVNINKANNLTEAEVPEPELTDTIIKLEITDGSTYGKLMEQAEVSSSEAMAIFAAAEDVYDLSRIRAGRKLDLIYDKDTDELKQLIYQIDTEEELSITKKLSTLEATSTIWQAERQQIDYEIKIKTSEGTITTSMYEAALEQGIDERAIIDLANAFQWSVDFAMDVREGDSFKFIYEERYRAGEYVMPGQILAGKFVNAGTPFYAYYFDPSSAEASENKESQGGFYDENANSVQKMFLKAPVAFKYISSGFTTGLRYIEDFNVSTGHRAIDYAASAGTPVRAVGDGVVTLAGWNGSYGRKVSIRHNGIYSTNYAHLSGFAVKRGQKVKQGQTIGYVGSTGFSTGPHLHYEMVKYGVKVNPLREILPPGEPIKEENKERFYNEISKYKDILDQ